MRRLFCLAIMFALSGSTSYARVATAEMGVSVRVINTAADQTHVASQISSQHSSSDDSAQRTTVTASPAASSNNTGSFYYPSNDDTSVVKPASTP